MNALVAYFTRGITSQTLETVGAEVETQFLDQMGGPITIETSQRILKRLVSELCWKVDSHKGDLITSLIDDEGHRIFYELGRHNIEVATRACAPDGLLHEIENCLGQLYFAARTNGARPYFGSVLKTDEDLLVIPDKRDATWLTLDGREPLNLLTRISSVQFTISVAPEDALRILNALGESLRDILVGFPQDVTWKRYIRESHAGYREDRYGGPLRFASIGEYCHKLIQHDVVQGARLVPFEKVLGVDISLYLRSVWWHFRLKRYGNSLCIEVRPFGRGKDSKIQQDFASLRSIF